MASCVAGGISFDAAVLLLLRACTGGPGAALLGPCRPLSCRDSRAGRGLCGEKRLDSIPGLDWTRGSSVEFLPVDQTIGHSDHDVDRSDMARIDGAPIEIGVAIAGRTKEHGPVAVARHADLRGPLSGRSRRRIFISVPVTKKPGLWQRHRR